MVAIKFSRLPARAFGPTAAFARARARASALTFICTLIALTWSLCSPAPSQASIVDTAWGEAIDAGEEAYKGGHKKIAEDLFQEALKEAEKFPPNDTRLAATLNDLAIIYDETSRYDQAEDCYKKALAIREKALGPDSADVATTLNNLANLYKDQGKYAQAEPMYRRVIEVYAKTKGAESEFMAMSYHNLAVLYEMQGRNKEAIPLYKSALQIGDKTLGPDDDHVVDLVGNLAALYDKEGNKAEARPLFKRYLQKVKGALGLKADDPKTMQALKSFASSMRQGGQAANANLVEKALEYQRSGR